MDRWQYQTRLYGIQHPLTPPNGGGNVSEPTVKGLSTFFSCTGIDLLALRLAVHSRGRECERTYSKKPNGIYCFTGIDLLSAAIRRPPDELVGFECCLHFKENFLFGKFLQPGLALRFFYQ